MSISKIVKSSPAFAIWGPISDMPYQGNTTPLIHYARHWNFRFSPCLFMMYVSKVAPISYMTWLMRLIMQRQFPACVASPSWRERWWYASFYQPRYFNTKTFYSRIKLHSINSIYQESNISSGSTEISYKWKWPNGNFTDMPSFLFISLPKIVDDNETTSE